MPKRPKTTPKRLMRAEEPAINLTNDLAIIAEILIKQRSDQNLDYALVTTTKHDDINDINDEFQREVHFIEQAKQAALEVIPRVEDLGIPTRIPATYKGEMVKDEKQMGKINDNLKSKKDSIERSEKVKKLRELKKLGKKIQEEVLRKRAKEKKDFLQKVKTKPVSELFD